MSCASVTNNTLSDSTSIYLILAIYWSLLLVSKIILLIICKAYIQGGACLKQVAHVTNNALSDKA